MVVIFMVAVAGAVPMLVAVAVARVVVAVLAVLAEQW